MVVLEADNKKKMFVDMPNEFTKNHSGGKNADSWNNQLRNSLLKINDITERVLANTENHTELAWRL